MIESMHIENFKCFKNFDIELGKFNVLIGPNDSGKTAFLQAVRVLTVLCSGTKSSGSDVAKELGFHLGRDVIWRKDPSAQVKMCSPSPSGAMGRYAEVSSVDGTEWKGVVTVMSEVQKDDNGPGGHRHEDAMGRQFSKQIGPSSMYRLEPPALRRPSALLDKAFQIAENGEGLPSLLLSIAGEDPDRSKRLRSEFARSFGYTPKTRQLGKRVTIAFETQFGDLPAESVSDGVILSLGFLAITYLPKPPSILLVEEPENGIHPGRLEEIVATLRRLSKQKGVQVIATTHSPYLLDLVQPEEVRIFSKDAEGAVHATNMASAKDIEFMRKHFQTGEIWTCLSEDRLVRGAGEKR